MEHHPVPFLQNENQRDAPLSNTADNYTPPSTLKDTLKSWMLWQFLLLGCFTGISVSITMITIPIVGRQYFDESSTDDDDNGCDPSSYSRFALWASVFKSLSGLIALLSQSYIGRLTDAFGRKRFLYLVCISTTMPYLPLCFTDNIWYYFALSPIWALSGMTSGMPTILQAAISDVTAPQFRTTVYSILFGVAAIALMAGSVSVMMIVEKWGLRAAFYALMAINMVSLLYLCFGVKESLKTTNRKPLEDDVNIFDKNNEYAVRQQIELNKIGLDISDTGNVQYDEIHGQQPHVQRKRCCSKCFQSKLNPLRTLCYMRSNPVIWWIGILTFLTAFPETGVSDIAMIYIADNLQLCDENKNSEINTYLTISFAAFMIATQLLIAPLFARFMTDIKLMSVSVATLLCSFLFGVVLYFWRTTSIALVLYGLHGMSLVIIPVFAGSLSKRISPREQGVAMGVIHAIKGLNASVAPFVFGWLYWFFSDKLSNAGFLISFPFMLGAAITLIAYPIMCGPLKRIFNQYDEYAFRASIVAFDENPDSHIPPPQQLL